MATKEKDDKLMRVAMDVAKLVEAYSKEAKCSQKQALTDIVFLDIDPDYLGVRQYTARAIVEQLKSGKSVTNRAPAEQMAA